MMLDREQRHRSRPPHGKATAAATVAPALFLLLPLLVAGAAAYDGLPRHAMELRALLAPEEVLEQLPALLAQARDDDDARQLALLHLAEANACRVLARWLCQRDAAAAAHAAAQRAGDPVLEVRGLILDSRALMALQDYTRAESLLVAAELRLAEAPHAELSADVQLGYSTLSHALGKHQFAADYAERGLAMLDGERTKALQARLQRNLGRALIQLDRYEAARVALERGLHVVPTEQDPKLSVDLLLESANLARRMRDRASQRRHIEAVLELAQQLDNAHLYGQGYEALGLAYQQDGDLERAQQHLQLALRSFRQLDQEHDELRVGQALIEALLDRQAPSAELAPLVRRLMVLQGLIDQRDRAQAADDFETRLQYAQQQLELTRLETGARLAAERAETLQARERLGQLLTATALLLTAIAIAFFLQQRRSNARLQRVVAALRESEAKANDLLQLSPGLVFLHDLDGRLLLVNPAAAAALEGTPETLVGRPLAGRLDSAGQTALAGYLAALKQAGEAEVQFDLATGPDDRPPRHWRVTGRVSAAAGAQPYVVGHAVDITDETETALQLREQALHDALTGCYNRRYLEVFAAEQDPAARWAAINIDLDHFKRINDAFGHERGDQVLRETADFLHARLRAQDALVRTGGDEFLLLLDADETFCQQLLARLETDRDQAPCGYSLGFARREAGEDLDQTLARADTAMYERRRRKRGSEAKAGD